MHANTSTTTYAALLGVLLLAACAKQEEPAGGVPFPMPTSTAAGETPPPEPSADPLGALSLPDMRTCLGKCTDDSRMRGVGAEQIEADCREQCGKSCLSHCEEASEPQKSRCKQDCERQSETTKLP